MVFSLEYLVVLVSVAGLLVSGNLGPNQIKLVAVADGKSFFAEHTPYRDWAGAAAYCKTYGMQLASITSRAQFNALNASYSNDFKQDFWTSGRDALAPNQFAWNSTDIAATADAIDYRRDRSVSARTCLLFFSDPQESYTYSLVCSVLSGTLCESGQATV